MIYMYIYVGPLSSYITGGGRDHILSCEITCIYILWRASQAEAGAGRAPATLGLAAGARRGPTQRGTSCLAPWRRSDAIAGCVGALLHRFSFLFWRFLVALHVRPPGALQARARMDF